MTQTIRLAISTCPNDTFAFAGLLLGTVGAPGLDFQWSLLDIQQLNDGLFAGQFDVAKASFFAALRLADEMVVLPAGSAVGFGVGPLLLAAQEGQTPADRSQLTLCPGELTTAHFLFRAFYGQTAVEHVLFSDIMPRLQRRTADFGVCIHEGRFTYAQQGLACVADLGQLWETETGQPLPLGGILGRRSLPDDVLQRVNAAIVESLRWAQTHRDEAAVVMRQHAQELDEHVLWQHVELYVNEWTLDLGERGAAALAAMQQYAIDRGMVAATKRLRILK